MLIAANDEALEVARAQETGGVPMVVVEGDLSRTRWAVGVDQVAGAALGHRAPDRRSGHTDIAHVAGPASWTEADARPPGLARGDVRRRAAAAATPFRATGPPPAATRPAGCWPTAAR